MSIVIIFRACSNILRPQPITITPESNDFEASRVAQSQLRMWLQ